MMPVKRVAAIKLSEFEAVEVWDFIFEISYDAFCRIGGNSCANGHAQPCGLELGV
jgi:hypothetical protein